MWNPHHHQQPDAGWSNEANTQCCAKEEFHTSRLIHGRSGASIETCAGPLIELPLTGTTPKAPVPSAVRSRRSFVSTDLQYGHHIVLPPSTQTSIHSSSQRQVGRDSDRTVGRASDSRTSARLGYARQIQPNPLAPAMTVN